MTFKDMQMMFPEYPDALDAKQVCEMLGTSTKTLYKMIDACKGWQKVCICQGKNC